MNEKCNKEKIKITNYLKKFCNIDCMNEKCNKEKIKITNCLKKVL
jgi:hypothetical protein